MTKELPIACSLGTDELEGRRAEWAALLNANLIDSTATDSGVRLRLRASSTVSETLDRLIASESKCCPWMSWSLGSEADTAVLEVMSNSPVGRQALVELFSPSN